FLISLASTAILATLIVNGGVAGASPFLGKWRIDQVETLGLDRQCDDAKYPVIVFGDAELDEPSQSKQRHGPHVDRKKEGRAGHERCEEYGARYACKRWKTRRAFEQRKSAAMPGNHRSASPLKLGGA
ncbi:hypothetical protein, partial [Xanthomonas euvesicatoria]|uniref:hypothetical protein n=1 Tax=Xanthomonas euvesicatoria TaxID=456327 RepID=UPI0031B5AF15